ncbi:MAG TPA: hypothetical protein VFO61_01860 [Alphaproteobacteria bacterium]|nr:hypothetical protein [Alphaproteobacteria bacterium]
MTIRPYAFALSLLLAALSAGAAWAGAPYRTDDPEPTEYRHWEVYAFSTGTHKSGDTSGVLPGLEADYGAAPNLQLHVIAPLAFDKPADSGTKIGPGDAEFGFKYRFIQGGENDWWPDVAIFPAVDVPTGDEERGLGTGHTHVFLPVWLGKDFGNWTTYGGGGYWNNPGAGDKNYWFAGWLLQRQVTKALALGGELFHQTADTEDGKASTGFNVGAIYDFSDDYHLLISAGRGIRNIPTTNEFSYYLGLLWTFGPEGK